jgi:hypothetical protein
VPIRGRLGSELRWQLLEVLAAGTRIGVDQRGAQTQRGSLGGRRKASGPCPDNRQVDRLSHHPSVRTTIPSRI